MNRMRKAIGLLVIGAVIWAPSQIYAQGEPLTPRQEQTFLLDGTAGQIEIQPGLPGKSENVDRAGALDPATAPTATPLTTARPAQDPTLLLEDIAETARLLAERSIDLAIARVVDDLNNGRLAEDDLRLSGLGLALAGWDLAAILVDQGKADKAIKVKKEKADQASKESEKAWKEARKAYKSKKAPYFFEPTAQPVDPVPTLTLVRDNLELTMAPDPKVQDHIAEATDKIDEALTPESWSGSTVLDKDVFKNLTDAVDKLEKVLEDENATGGDVALAQQAIEYLLATEQYLIETQVLRARVEILADLETRNLRPGDHRLADLGSAFKELTKVAEKQSTAEYKKASDSYKKAWERASKAIN